MRHSIVVPSDPGSPSWLPRGAAILAEARGQYLVYAGPGAFGERCAQALHRRGRVCAAGALPPVTAVGWFDDFEGEVRLIRGKIGMLEQWVGHQVHRNDLQARDNRADRRAEARRLALRGDLPGAYRLDRNLGF